MFLDVWENATAEDVFNEFMVADSEREGIDILFAWYDCPPYEGHAFVLFRKDGKLYEVNGSHCSCFGLEGQWEPEEVTVESIKLRCKEGRVGWGYERDLEELIDSLEE